MTSSPNFSRTFRTFGSALLGEVPKDAFSDGIEFNGDDGQRMLLVDDFGEVGVILGAGAPEFLADGLLEPEAAIERLDDVVDIVVPQRADPRCIVEIGLLVVVSRSNA